VIRASLPARLGHDLNASAKAYQDQRVPVAVTVLGQAVFSATHRGVPAWELEASAGVPVASA
jgi:hypothetical protein